MGAIRFGGTDEHDESREGDPGRAIEVAASDVVLCLWSSAYARLCTSGLPRDVRTARDRGIPVVVLKMPTAPPVPLGFFPAGTRIAYLPADPGGSAEVIARIQNEGHEWCDLIDSGAL